MHCRFLNSRLQEILDVCQSLVKIKDIIFPIQVHRPLNFIRAPWASADPRITTPVLQPPCCLSCLVLRQITQFQLLEFALNLQFFLLLNPYVDPVTALYGKSSIYTICIPHHPHQDGTLFTVYHFPCSSPMGSSLMNLNRLRY